MSKLCMGCMSEIPDEAQFCPACGYREGTLPKESYHLTPGTVLNDRYIVGRVLGFGSFGITYIGYDVRLNRVVAVKEYLPGEFSTRSMQDTMVNVYTGESEEQFRSGMVKFMEDAKSTLLNLGLDWDIRTVESNVAPDCVVSQDLKQDSITDSGKKVELTVSEGADNITGKTADEDLAGKTWGQALKLAEQSGYYIKRSRTEYSDTVPEDEIIEQASEKTEAGEPVAALVVSDGKERVSVPDIEFVSVEEAEKLLKETELSYKIIEKTSQTVPDGSVISQSIPANTRVKKGTQINVTVSSGKEGADRETETQTQAQTEPETRPPQTQPPQIQAQTQPQTQTQTQTQTQAPEQNPVDTGEGSFFDMIDF